MAIPFSLTHIPLGSSFGGHVKGNWRQPQSNFRLNQHPTTDFKGMAIKDEVTQNQFSQWAGLAFGEGPRFPNQAGTAPNIVLSYNFLEFNLQPRIAASNGTLVGDD